MQVYIISKADLKVSGVAQTVRYEINEDATAPAQSSFLLVWPIPAVIGDFIYIRNEYIGIISGIEADKHTSVVTLRALPVSSIFSRSILLGCAQEYIETYIFNQMTDNFISSVDSLLDIPYISVTVKTQTALDVAPHNDNGIYNLDTFLRYAAKRHHIYTGFELTPESLNVSIENRTPSLHIIDATVADVFNVTETVGSECVSKVTVKTPEGVQTFYLFADGSYGIDPLAGARVVGKADTVYCENPEDARKTAGEVFAKNRYDHLIEAEIISGSKLYDVSNMRLYDRAKVKTRTGIYDSYISYKGTKSTARTVLFRFGDAKVSLTDKLKGGN
jgi:hypothetical protein